MAHCSYVNGEGGCTGGTFSSFVQSISPPPPQVPGATQVSTIVPPLVFGGNAADYTRGIHYFQLYVCQPVHLKLRRLDPFLISLRHQMHPSEEQL